MREYLPGRKHTCPVPSASRIDIHVKLLSINRVTLSIALKVGTVIIPLREETGKAGATCPKIHS